MVRTQSLKTESIERCCANPSCSKDISHKMARAEYCSQSCRGRHKYNSNLEESRAAKRQTYRKNIEKNRAKRRAYSSRNAEHINARIRNLKILKREEMQAQDERAERKRKNKIITRIKDVIPIPSGLGCILWKPPGMAA